MPVLSRCRTGLQSPVILLVAALLLHGLPATAPAVPPGRTIEWKTPMGTVSFDGGIHASKGLRCDDCHPGIFEKEQGASSFRMADIKMRKFCGECHNGVRAFDANDGTKCTRCHRR